MPSSPATEQAYEAYRDSMDRRERAAIRATLKAYRDAIVAANARIERLREGLEARPQDEWRRYAISERESVVRELEAALDEAARRTAPAVDTQRAAAAGEAVVTTSEAVTTTLADAGRDVLAGQVGGAVNRASVQAVMAQVYTQSPVTEMLRAYSASGARRAGDRIVQAVALGENPRKIAAALRRELGTEAWRAQRIARTEVIRAHTAGAIATMRATPTVTPAYEWTCRSATACIACLGNHGQVFSTDQPPARHPNCRCVMLPVVIDPTTGQALSQPLETGQDVIDRMSLDEAQERFGIKRGAMLKAPDANRVSVRDMVTTRSSDKWGSTVAIVPLRELAA